MLFHNKIRLRNLAASEKFDTKIYNFCITNGLIDLERIIQHYLNDGNFLNLKRFNVFVNQKLISVCKKYLSDQPQSINISEIKPQRDEFSAEAKKVISAAIGSISISTQSISSALAFPKFSCCFF